MGFLSRSKSLRRQQSSLNTSRSDKSEEERFYKQRHEQRSAVNVNVTQSFDVSSAKLEGRFPRDATKTSVVNRPTTSSGRAQRSNPLPTPDKELPNPDSQIKTQTIEIKADSHIYRFPTPTGTPRTAAHHNPPHNTSDITIGIALGSPRLPPQYLANSPRALPEANRASPLRTFSEPVRTPVTATPITPTTAEPTKLRKSKSRSFKSMFSSSSAAKPRQQVEWQPPVPAAHWQMKSNASREDASTSLNSQRSLSSNATTASTSNTSHQSQSTNASSVSKPIAAQPAHNRSDSNARVFARQQMRAELDKAAYEAAKAAAQQPKPKPANMQIFPTVQTLSPIQRGKYTEIRIPQINQDALERINSGTGGIQQSSLLNVDIPKSEMERYSVMFEKLLKPTTSIAERRGTLKRLRPLGEETSLAEPVDNTPRRRATSPSMPSRPSPNALPKPSTKPSPKPSPGREIIEKSIQETNKHHMEAANRLLQIQRSRTAPAGSTTLHPHPGSGPILIRPNQQPSAPAHSSSRDDSPASPLWSEASLPVTPDSSVAQTFFSIGSDSDNEDIIVTQQAVARSIPKITEPGPDPRHTPGPKRMDSLDPEQEPSPPSHHRAQKSQQVQYGQVGVARTVSLSRAKNTRHVPVAVKQPLRPRVVDVDTRKSTLVLIEQA
ncbi:hypothetical protein KVT40_001074 [Elsinoe batatas]|uniref:Uncharacterized protein n=1 Tax=Elsinoe batatas TaxID=2601811 RepID=A0A8K0PN94_9PEZI|nr:hypothetical protein KVT40_001074 [Elsinoe batatas]